MKEPKKTYCISAKNKKLVIKTYHRELFEFLAGSGAIFIVMGLFMMFVFSVLTLLTTIFSGPIEDRTGVDGFQAINILFIMLGSVPAGIGLYKMNKIKKYLNNKNIVKETTVDIKKFIKNLSEKNIENALHLKKYSDPVLYLYRNQRKYKQQIIDMDEINRLNIDDEQRDMMLERIIASIFLPDNDQKEQEQIQIEQDNVRKEIDTELLKFYKIKYQAI